MEMGEKRCTVGSCCPGRVQEEERASSKAIGWESRLQGELRVGELGSG